jgi:hypothetical protein
MITANEKSVLDEPISSATKPEILIAAVLHLMSHYSSRSALNKEQGVCVKLATVIERHLAILSELPDLGPVLRETCGQLSEQWQLVVECTLPEQSKENLLRRWFHVAQFN